MANKGFFDAFSKSGGSDRHDIYLDKRRSADDTALRKLISRVKRDPQSADEFVDSFDTKKYGTYSWYPQRGIYRVVRRMLESKVGLQWDDVFSEISRKHDKRSGRYDALYRALEYYVCNMEEALVKLSSRWHRRLNWFYVDDDGILRNLSTLGSASSADGMSFGRTERNSALMHRRAKAFLGDGRSVIRHASGGLCFVEQKPVYRTEWAFNKYGEYKPTGREIFVRWDTGKQLRTLTEKERKYWERFPEYIRKIYEIRPVERKPRH